MNVNNARKWVGRPDAVINVWGFVWDTEQKRMEFWISDGTDGWEIEMVCFDTTPPHYIVFGEFDKTSFVDQISKLGIESK